MWKAISGNLYYNDNSHDYFSCSICITKISCCYNLNFKKLKQCTRNITARVRVPLRSVELDSKRIAFLKQSILKTCHFQNWRLCGQHIHLSVVIAQYNSRYTRRQLYPSPYIILSNYIEVTRAAWDLRSPVAWSFVLQSVQANSEET